MSLTLLLFFAGPIGFFLYLMDRKHRVEHEKMFADFLEELDHREGLTVPEKLDLAEKMFRLNGFATDEKTADSLTVSKKWFSIGLALMGFSLFGIGLGLYLFWFYFLQPSFRETVHF